MTADPVLTFDEALPISAHVEEIRDALRNHQVIVVAGETGSGKTTQLPKIAMTLGRGVAGLIGHTQPRRLAARTVANRIAEELQTEPGGCIGYKVRFSDHVSDNTMVKLMTDGILRGSGAMVYFVIATIPDLILRILFACLLTPHFGSTGIWMAWPFGWLAATGLTIFFYRKVLKKMRGNNF